MATNRVPPERVEQQTVTSLDIVQTSAGNTICISHDESETFDSNSIIVERHLIPQLIAALHKFEVV